MRSIAAPVRATPTGSVITLGRVPRRRGRERPEPPAANPVADSTASAGPAHTAETDGGVSATATPSSFNLTDAYDDHGGHLFGFALNALRDRDAAEDCVQETFLRAWRSRQRYDPERASTRTWLFAIARNVIADVLRSRQRLPQVADTERLVDVPVHDADPVERLELAEALARLSREQRQAVVAIHLVGMTYGELSTALEVPAATLRTRAFYGLRALRRHLDERAD